MTVGWTRRLYGCLRSTETENDRKGRLERGEQKESDARGTTIRIYRAENFGLTQRTIQVRNANNFEIDQAHFAGRAINH